MIARFGAIPFSRYRIVQGTHLNSPPLHHPLTASRYRRSTATDLDSISPCVKSPNEAIETRHRIAIALSLFCHI
ncbi:hypothetical protein CKA32_004523 [Geitlerinema sp. FC II]|nr:hypothetical protein CKA32_004523 [Geitlerinema sp. FC II]